MVIKKILVGCDFSEQANVAIAKAAALAAQAKAELILCHVSVLADSPMPTKMEAEETEKAASRNRDALEAISTPLREAGITVSHHVRLGYPDDGILAAAKEFDVDLIVTGTHGRTGLSRFFLGSIAEKVVRLAETNVLVSRSSGSDDQGFKNVLVPTDFSPASKKALDLGLQLAAPGANVTLFHAWSYPAGIHSKSMGSDKDPLAELKAEIVADAEAKGSEWIDKYGQGDVNLTFEQVYGPPSGAVGDHLDSGKYDLVAMGTHGYRGFRRFILGSVAEATVRHAPCSVVVAHAGDTGDAG